MRIVLRVLGLGCFTKSSTLFQLVGENCFTSVRVRVFYESVLRNLPHYFSWWVRIVLRVLGLGCFTKPSTLFQLVGENCFTSVRVRVFYETFHTISIGG